MVRENRGPFYFATFTPSPHGGACTLDPTYVVPGHTTPGHTTPGHSISNINAATSTQPYADAMLMIAHFYKRTGDIQQEVVSSVPDKAMQTQLGGYCNQVSLTYHNLLVKHAEYIEYYNLINKNYFFHHN